MPVRFVIFLTYMWTTLHTIFALASLDNTLSAFDPGGNSQADAINALPFISIISMQEVFFVPFQIPIPSATFFQDLQTLLFWQYPFFDGNWFFVRLFLLFPISVATMLLMAVTVGPLIISAASLIVSVFVGPVARTLSGGVKG